MAGQHMLAVVLDGCWTLWLLVALWLVGWRLGWARWILLFGFCAIALLLGFTTGLSWRGYLMAWLGVHVVLATAVAASIVVGRRLQVPAALVSLAGLATLWVQGGAGHWQYVAWSAACVVCAGAGFAVCWTTAFRAERRKTATLNNRLLRTDDMYQRERRNARVANQSIQAAEEGRRLADEARQAAEDELVILRTGYERQRRESEALRLELDKARLPPAQPPARRPSQAL